MISTSSLTFLKNLAKNNNREWFNEHKETYTAAYAEFGDFMQDLAVKIGSFDPDIKKALGNPKTVKIFRIYRDVRFSKDKSPYKKNFGGVITTGGMKYGHPGYYVHIEPGNSFLGGGLHMPEPKVLSNIRETIAQDAKSLRKILANATFKKFYKGLGDYDALKTVPRGFPKNHPDADLLKLKSISAMMSVSDSKVTAKNFMSEVVKAFKALKPLNAWLMKASV